MASYGSDAAISQDPRVKEAPVKDSAENKNKDMQIIIIVFFPGRANRKRTWCSPIIQTTASNGRQIKRSSRRLYAQLIGFEKDDLGT